MPSFDTPDPISVTAHVYSGSIRFTAGDRTDTVVAVEPRDPERDQDARVVEQTEVSCANGTVSIRTPKANLVGRSGTVDVTVELPTGSHIEVSGASAQVLGEGRLGEVRLKTSAGDVRLDTTGPLQLSVAHGSITVDRVEGMAEINTNSGHLRIGVVDGPAVLKNSHGSTTVDAVTGELRVNGVNGGVDVARVESSVTGTTTNGHLRVNDVARGTVHLETSNGQIEVGIREGSAAWLDVSSKRGQVRNTLSSSDAPEETDETVRVHARSNWGNIDIRRART
ncbi:hypothetical protein SZN_29590 [Streptomyces zinciresistens K42]|uniref:DUF4097 domain-containing protein n=1 Tax=Streptomyces zinciresistens K42 TaxID=700597 RepID=G2GK75_9ACTN|nr:DUF4097 family beta strand repeat-containing protein [Streptomyces zinciresistens]EGX56096.1 hypothetical protein SZN_29590 [Streptomyces zinciresistens K42]